MTPMKTVRETMRISNAYERDQILYREGRVVEGHGDGTVSWKITREWCDAVWSDGRTSYEVSELGEGRWGWSVSEHALDPEDDWSRVRRGEEGTYEAAWSHLPPYVRDPDHFEVIGFNTFDAPTDEEMERWLGEGCSL